MGVTLSVVVAGTFLFYELSGRERDRVIAAKVQASLMLTDLLASSLAAPLDFEDEDATREALGHAKNNEDILWVGAFTASGDRLIASSAKGADTEPPTLGTAQPTEGATLRADSVLVTKKVTSRSGNHIGTAVMVLTLEPENRALLENRRSILQLCVLLGLGTATLIVLVIRWQIVRPLLRLADAARGLSEKRDRVRVEVKSRDEVGVLARAFNDMADTVVDRERALDEARSRVVELLDNMRQGIVVFDRDRNIVGPQSKAATELFGHEDLNGLDVSDLLFGGDDEQRVERTAFVEWQDLASAVSSDDWAEVAALAPREAVLRRGGQLRVLELEFRSLGDGRIMLLAADVSAARALRSQVEQKSREAAGLRRAIAGAHVFVQFLTSAKTRLRHIRELCAQPGGALDRHTLLRHVHTLKGEASVYELSAAVGAARAIEQLLASASGQPPGAELGEHVSALSAAIDDAEQRFVELAGKDALARVPVDRSVLDELLAATEGRSDQVAQLTRALSARPFGEVVATLAERVPVWAEQTGKDAELRVTGAAVPIPPDLAPVLSGAIVHLVRNAVAHGIEPREDRVRAHKPERGRIELRCAARTVGLSIEVLDDGVGIDSRDRSRVFEPGFSTQAGPGELAGRGVGLYAVRAELAGAGYGISLAEDGPGTKFVIAPVE